MTILQESLARILRERHELNQVFASAFNEELLQVITYRLGQLEVQAAAVGV